MPLQVKDANGATKRTSQPVGATYHFAGSTFTPVATPTAIVVVKASASKTVYLHRVRLSGGATAAGTMPVVITKRSDDGTPNTAVLAAISPCHDTDDAANTGSVSTVGTANYGALGTADGIVAAGRLCLTALGSGLGVSPFVFEPKKPIALKLGSTEELTIELGGAAVPAGGKIDWEVVTEEE